MSEVRPLVVIGGGAAGFFGAIAAAEAGVERVLLLEKSGKCLGKVKISGGGRCNVTHHCFEPRELVRHYPRGGRSLVGPFTHFGPAETIKWFAGRGVDLKTEADGRMFPTTDSSQTVIDCLHRAAREAGVEVRTRCGVKMLRRADRESEDGARSAPEDAAGASRRLVVELDDGTILHARSVLLATGGSRVAAGARLAAGLGHGLNPPVPSLFTFQIEHPLLAELAGVSVEPVEVSIPGTRLSSRGPLLITHWGVSGPGILKLSAFGARELAERDYHFALRLDWLPDEDAAAIFAGLRQTAGKRQLGSRSPFASISRRLWTRFLVLAGVAETTTWAQLPRGKARALEEGLHRGELPVTGKSLNKDEFVTAGGVPLQEIDLKTMASRKVPGLYFAGEVMDVDGVTGGFNFQNAWTSGYLAGRAVAGEG